MKIKNIILAGLVGCTMAAAPVLTSCSDVEYEEANFSEGVRNLIAEYTQGNRQVTLRWDNPTLLFHQEGTDECRRVVHREGPL